MKVENITSFVFQRAEYRISDGKSNIILVVDYKQNTFSIRDYGHEIDQTFKKEIERIAVDLLIRKHQINFAHK